MRSTKIFCSDKCRVKNGGLHSILEGVNSGTVGAIGELMAASDLLKKGYEVYRALSPASRADLIAIKNGNTFDIDVTTGYENSEGKLFHPKKLSLRRTSVIAVVVHKTGDVKYIPELNDIMSHSVGNKQ